MAKSLHDAGWDQFLQILTLKAERAGLITIAVNPDGTAQNCSGCGVKIPKTQQYATLALQQFFNAPDAVELTAQTYKEVASR